MQGWFASRIQSESGDFRIGRGRGGGASASDSTSSCQIEEIEARAALRALRSQALSRLPGFVKGEGHGGLSGGRVGL